MIKRIVMPWEKNVQPIGKIGGNGPVKRIVMPWETIKPDDYIKRPRVVDTRKKKRAP